jgi:uncharacterized protein YqhQ
MPTGEYLQYGGQAIIEGVMMRSPKYFSVACRAPNGTIVLQAEPLAKTWIGRQKWLKAPFLRGTLALLDALALGARAMSFSSAVQLEKVHQSSAEGNDDAERSIEGSEIVRPQAKGGGSLMKLAVVGTIILSLGLGVLIFVATPVWIAQLFTYIGVKSQFGLNVVEGVVKAAVFMGYLAAIGRMKDGQEVFKYHGAEHKAINTLEAGQELIVENAAAQTRLHPRCGTSFAIIVLLVSIVLFTELPRSYDTGSVTLDLFIRIGLKLLILPIIAGIAYEAIRFAGKFRDQRWVMALFWPGLKSQLLTTREPEPRHIEVALVALRSVLDLEAGKPTETQEPQAAIN